MATNGTVNYGDNDITALQITTGLYPTTGTPLDVRLVIDDAAIIGTHTPVGLQLYTGMQLYARNTDEQITVVGLSPYGTGSGVYWDDWDFSTIIAAFKNDIDDAQNIDLYSGVIRPRDYSVQNLLNYLYLRIKNEDTATLTVNYYYDDAATVQYTETYVLTVGQEYNYVPRCPDGYTANPSSISGTMQRDTVVDVTWEKNEYSLLYFLGDGDQYGETEYYNYMQEIKVPADPTDPLDTGRDFLGWTYEPGLLLGDNGSLLMPNDNVVAMAEWGQEKTYYTVTVESDNPEYGTVSGGGRFESNTTCTVTATPNGQDYGFVGWKIGNDIVSTNKTYSLQVISDTTITAVFEDLRVSVYTRSDTVPSGDGGTVIRPTNGTYRKGETIRLEASTNEGFVFGGWYTSYDGENWDEIRGSEDMDYTIPVRKDYSNLYFKARFAKSVPVSVSVPGNLGTVYINGAETVSVDVPYGSSVTIHIEPANQEVYISPSAWTITPDISGYTFRDDNRTITIDSLTEENGIDVTVSITSGQSRVFAYVHVGDTELSSEEMRAIAFENLGSEHYVTVPDNELTNTYGVHVDQAMSPNTYAYVVVAMPSNFSCKSSDEFFAADGVDKVGFVRSIVNTTKQIDGKEYKLFESDRRDISSTGGGRGVNLLFGDYNASGSWSAQWNKTETDNTRITL